MDSTSTQLAAALEPLAVSSKRKAAQGDGAAAAAAAAEKRSRPSRTVLVFGTGECAQLGLGEDRLERKFPTRVDLPDTVARIECGGSHSVVVTDDGALWTWGCNDEKALGRTGDEWVPGPVSLSVHIVKVSAGDSHSLALSQDGVVYAWGAYRDAQGMMGFTPGTEEPSAAPTPMKFGTRRLRAVDIASGANHSLALLENGDMYEWGHIRIGQKYGGTMCAHRHRLADCCGRVFRHRRGGLLVPRLVNVKRTEKLVKIFAGAYHSWAVSKSGKVFAVGLNQYCQAGLDGPENLHALTYVPGLDGAVKLSGGLHHSLALLPSGQVYAFGRNNYGELGMNDLNERRTPTLVPGLKDIAEVACGSTHSLAVDKDGHVYSCGFGDQLQLGSGSVEDRKSFERVGGAALEALRVVSASAGSQFTLLLAEPR